jgi:hypothetical protein
MLRALPTQWVPRSFAFFAKGGSRKCRPHGGLITCPQQNQIARSIASHPCKTARMGHPQGERCTQRSLKLGHPPILASLHMQTADDLFGGPQGSPRSDKLIAASVQWAEKIMEKIDSVFRSSDLS